MRHSLRDGWLPLAALIPWAKNPRKNDAAVPKVGESIKRFGFVAPIVIWEGANRMVAGHTRYKAMQVIMEKDPGFVAKGAPGPGLVRVVFHEFSSEDEADAYALAAGLRIPVPSKMGSVMKRASEGIV